MGLFDRFRHRATEETPTAPLMATLAPFTRLVIDGDVQVRLIESTENSISSDNSDTAALCRHDRDTLYIGDNEMFIITRTGNSMEAIGGGRIDTIMVDKGNSFIGDSNITARLLAGSSNNRLREKSAQLRSCTIRVPQLPKVRLKSGSLHVQGFAGQTIDYCVAGSGSIRHDGADAATAKLEICSRGDMLLGWHRLEDRQLDAQIFGSGDIRIRGRAQSADISLTGSGSIHLGDCPVAEARVSLLGSGNIRLDAADSVSGTLSGGQLALMREPRERRLTVRECSRVYVINREDTA